MDKILIYINYVSNEYTNYFHLSVNDDVVMKDCPEERVDKLFERMMESVNAKKFELCVIQDVNASEWDYLKAFQEHGIEICPTSEWDSEKLCQIMDALFDDEYVISDKDDISDKKSVSILGAGHCFLQREDYEPGESLKQAKEILESGGQEMTELARIIKEKYERMKRNEQIR
jgi:hypothetical protein